MKKRLDKLLVDLGHASGRNVAQELIEQGEVLVDGIQIRKTNFKTDSTNIIVNNGQKYVGRGAHKLLGALEKFKLAIESKVVADFGASTGGFTQVLLERGAQKIYAIDVGHDQLAESIRQDPRVINREGVNLKNSIELEEEVDLVVIDISFISLEKILHNALSILGPSGQVIALIKPQFELGPKKLGKGGVVNSPADRLLALKKIYELSTNLQLWWKDVIPCPVVGRDGNQEYFFWGDRLLKNHLISVEQLLEII